MKGTKLNYGRVAQAFHWISALLIFTMLPLGLVMTRIGDGAVKTTLYRTHIIIGLIVLVLTVLRIIWVFIDQRPDILAEIPPWRQFVFKAVHILLYLLLLVLAVSGVRMLFAVGPELSLATLSPAAISSVVPQPNLHGIVSKIYIALLLAHIGGAIWYQVAKSDTFSRMEVTWLKIGQRI
ncbi:MAG: cytochrome b/b6 domain-containing protein [Anaerolineaceae bacterium]|nr:cytochrome b/b6 domain-containing protein [Anaerolineaceae bacterium]MCB9099784.1 cytochrome b/b6 domain-containing protein [Anaerolineales bacterium]